jgi:large subunit ribosomal protein L35
MPNRWTIRIRREEKMPKMKTKASVKKRFGVTATGKVKMKPSGMRHGMSKRPQSMKRKARKIGTLSAPDAKIVMPMMPYAKRG